MMVRLRMGNGRLRVTTLLTTDVYVWRRTFV